MPLPVSPADWATITISYVPTGRIVESKSVKLYVETFREEGIFHEHLARTIRDDFVAALDPRSLEVSRAGRAARRRGSPPFRTRGATTDTGRPIVRWTMLHSTSAAPAQ